MMWLAGVWAGQIPLASREEMWEDVKKHEEWFKGRSILRLDLFAFSSLMNANLDSSSASHRLLQVVSLLLLFPPLYPLSL